MVLDSDRLVWAHSPGIDFLAAPRLPFMTSVPRCFFGAIAANSSTEPPSTLASTTKFPPSPRSVQPSPGHRHSLNRPGWPTCSDDDPTLTATRCTTSPFTRSEPRFAPTSECPNDEQAAGPVRPVRSRTPTWQIEPRSRRPVHGPQPGQLSWQQALAVATSQISLPTVRGVRAEFKSGDK